jgi:low temperature requirement protein LtrA
MYVPTWYAKADGSGFVHGDELYCGHSSMWFRGAQHRHEGQIRAGGVDKGVLFAEAVETDLNDAIDGAYRTEQVPPPPEQLCCVHVQNRRTSHDDQARAALDEFLVMDDRRAEREQRVTPLELFFDLVVVFAITQVTQLMSDDLTWQGLGHGLLVLAAIWWAWTGYAWLTNTLEPEQGSVRAGMFGAMAGMLVVALAVPGAFGAHAVLFGVAYLLVRLLNLMLYAIAGKHDPDLRAALVRFAPTAALAPAIILMAGFVDGRGQVALWVIALGILYAGALIGRGQGWHISPAHFAERYGLIVIIALGESVVAIGVGAEGVSFTPGIVSAAILSIVVIAALWWAYFDVYAVQAQRQLSETGGAIRARLARDYYSYLHMPMIAGIVLFALGLKVTIGQVDEPLATIPAVALCGGLSLYFLTHVALRVRLVHLIRRATTERPGWIGPGRLVAAIGMLALIPAALALPALAALALVAALCWALIAWDVLHYRQLRSEVRRARP